MRRRSGRWLAVIVLAPFALAPFALACGTLLGIEPDPAGSGSDGGEAGAAPADADADAAVVGDALATDGPLEGCADADADCGVPACPGTMRSCPLASGGTTCVDDRNDDQNCGACGHVCNIAGSCASGDCVRRVFVTSATYMVGGNNTPRSLGDADAICQGIASTSGLKNTFRAWMSDSSQYPADGARFTQSTQPYQLLNGTPVASSLGGLMSGTLLAPINRDESGNLVTSGLAWTGTRVDGQRAPNAHCTSWSDDTAPNVANAGDVTATGAAWTESLLSCALSGHLYCFEQ